MNKMEGFDGANQQPIELRSFGKTYEVYSDSHIYKFNNLNELKNIIPKIKVDDIIIIAENAINDLKNNLISNPENKDLIHIIDKYIQEAVFEVLVDIEFEEPKENIIISENKKIEKEDKVDNNKNQNRSSIKKTDRLFNFFKGKERPLSKGEEEISRALIDGKWSINEELSFGDDIHAVAPLEQIIKELDRSIIRFNGKQYFDAQDLMNDLKATFPEGENIINTIILLLQLNVMADVTTGLLVGNRNPELSKALKIQENMLSITNMMNASQSLELRNIKNKNLQFIIQVPLKVRYEEEDKYIGLIRVITISRKDANKNWQTESPNTSIPSLKIKDFFVAEQDNLDAVNTKLLELKKKRL